MSGLTLSIIKIRKKKKTQIPLGYVRHRRHCAERFKSETANGLIEYLDLIDPCPRANGYRASTFFEAIYNGPGVQQFGSTSSSSSIFNSPCSHLLPGIPFFRYPLELFNSSISRSTLSPLNHIGDHPSSFYFPFLPNPNLDPWNHFPVIDASFPFPRALDHSPSLVSDEPSGLQPRGYTPS